MGAAMDHRRAASLLAAAALASALLAAGCGPAPGKRPAAGKENEYALEFGPEFKPFLASRDDLGISVEIAIDASGSMSSSPASGGIAKYRQASAALGEVARLLERLSRASPRGQVLKVGVLRFNEAVTEIMPLTAMDEAGLARLRAIVTDPANFQPSGSTAIGDAIAKGVRELSQSGTILRSLIVVTDGENKSGPDPAMVLSAVYGNRNSANSPEAPVLTGATLVSFIGFDIGSGAFDPLAIYGARVTSATDQAQLAAALSTSLEADVSKLEAPAPGVAPAAAAP
jgi:hypothetical protein